MGPPDDDAVLAAFDAFFAAAIESRDAAAAAAHFTADADVTMWGSDEAEQGIGPDAVRGLLEGIAASPASLSFRWSDRRVHVEGDVAWVTAAGDASADRGGGDDATIPYRVVAVLVRRGGRWLLHTYSGSEPQRPHGATAM